MKKILYIFIVTASFLFGATVVKLQSIKGFPMTGILVSDNNGDISQAQFGNGLSLNNGKLDVTSGIPTIVVTKVEVGTPNSFPIPTGKSICIVTRNIPQSINEDYTIVSGNVTFLTPPQPGDVVQLNCF